MNILAFLITVLSGVSFIIGYLIKKFTNKDLTIFSIGLSFSVLCLLVIFDLIPECVELFDKWYVCAIYVVLGIILLKVIDLFLPEHSHSKKSSHISHIGFMSFIALIIHNLIESTAIYVNASSDINAGIFMALGVSAHNIPLGIQISSLMNSNKKSLILVIGLSMSSVIGALLISLFNVVLNDVVLGILISITLGMLIYIIIFELLHEVKEHIKNKELVYGLIVGVLINIIITLL